MIMKDDDNIGNVIEEKRSVITFNCTKAEKAMFVRAAKGGKLVDWIMQTLNNEVARLNKNDSYLK
jgi:hypothetical protein